MSAHKVTLAAAAAALATAVPAQAQMNMNMPGMHMPGMKMPAPEQKPAAKKKTGKSQGSAAKAAPAKKAHQKATARKAAETHHGHDMSQMPGMTMPKGQAMPGMQMPEGQTMPGMQMPPGQGTTTDSDSEAAGTNLPAGNAAPPPIPSDHAADRSFPPVAMARARAQFRHEQGGQSFHKVLFNLAEYQVRNGRDGYRWDGEGRFGGDIDRLVVKTEGEGTLRKGIDSAEVQALYSHAIGPYFNLQAGVRHDFQPSPTRTYATVGVEGLAPYMFDTEAALFLSDKGDVLGRVEGWYDQRITQRLVLQPRVELNLAAQDVPEDRFGAGLVDAELGLRLRYEIRREFAPYVGISYETKVGRTASYARRAGEDVHATSLVLGIRTWF